MSRNTFYCVDNLKIKIEQFLKPSENALDFQCQEILKLVYKQLESFEETAKTTLRTQLYEAMRSEVRILRGIVAQICSVQFPEDLGNIQEDEDEGDDGVRFNMDDVESLKQRIHSFTPRLKMEEQSCVNGLYSLVPDDDEEEEEEEEDSDAVTSTMIGVCDVYAELVRKIVTEQVTSIVGMPGIGKTALANKLFHDPVIVECFDHRVWIRVGKKYRVKDIPRRILAEIDPDSVVTLCGADEEAVYEQLKEILKNKGYLIVLDDVWDRYATYLWQPYYDIDGMDWTILFFTRKVEVESCSQVGCNN